MFVQGFREAHQPVEAVRVLAGHDDRADAGEPVHQALGAQQVQGLADGVAGGGVLGAEGGLVGEGAGGEAAGQDLPAQQVGELPRPVRAQPAPAGGDGGRALAGVVPDAVGGWHAGNPTETVGYGVLPECCAMWGSVRSRADLGFRGGGGEMRHRDGLSSPP